MSESVNCGGKKKKKRRIASPSQTGFALQMSEHISTLSAGVLCIKKCLLTADETGLGGDTKKIFKKRKKN